jgi:WD40 repeat protein
VLTLRADFYDRPLMYPRFGKLVEEHTAVVLPLTPEELQQAIRRPAERVGAVLEKGLVEAISTDVEDQPGSLPLLQYALTELFERREGRMLTNQAYQQIGGVLGALGRRAEEVFAALDSQDKEIARQLFLRLVTLGEGAEDTRRRVLQSELEALASPDKVINILESFGKARLLSFDRDPATRGPTVEVAHEALMREWARLRTWLDESRADIRMQRLLGAATRDWLEGYQEPSFLLRGSRLAQFEEWSKETSLALTPNEKLFLEASLEDEARRKAQQAALERRSRNFLRALVAVFAVAAIVAVILTIFAFNQQGIAQENALVAEQNEATALAEADARATQQAIAESEADARATQQAIAESEANARAEAEQLALQERDRAVEAESDARMQAGILLASQAETELESGNTDRAILLALEALENYPYTPQAEHALGQAVTYNRALQIYEGHTAAVTGAAWSSDGKQIATSSTDNTVQIWDSASGELIRGINLPEGITGNQFDWGLTVKWSPDNHHVLTISGDRFLLGSQDYDLILWDAQSGEQVAVQEVQNSVPPDAGDTSTWFYHYTTGAGAEFAPDGRIATLGGDNTALIWSPILENLQVQLTGHTNAVNSIAWSPDFTQLATSSEDGTARIWDAQSGHELMILDDHQGGVNQVTWSPDGELLTTAGDDGTVRFWNPNTGEKLRQIDVGASTGSSAVDDHIVYTLSWSPDGAYLASGGGDGYIRLWNSISGESIAAIRGHDNFVAYLSWSPVGEQLVSAGADGEARIWNTAVNNMVLNLPYGYIELGNWSSDGKFLTVGTGPGPEKRYPGFAAVWDLDSGQPIFETSLDKDESWEWYTDYSPSSDYILARTMQEWPDITDANKLWLLDSQNGESIRVLETGRDDLVLIPDFSSDGTLVGVGDLEGMVFFWEVGSGELIKSINCLTWAHMVRWSPDGSKIALLCYDDSDYFGGQIRILDAGTYETMLIIVPDTESEYYVWFEWSPDSSKIAVAGGDDQVGSTTNPIYIYDANTGSELIEIIRHTGVVSAIDWSPNGKRIVTGSTDDTTRIWDAQSGAELLTLSTPGDWIINPAWSPDGQHLLIYISNTTGGPGHSGVWRVWQSTEELINYAKECCVFRELTPEEREQFGLPPEE